MPRPILNLPSLVAALLLALAVAALTATFGLIDAALLRPTPFTDAGRLTVLYQMRPGADGSVERVGWSWDRVSQLRTSLQSFASVASYSSTRVLLTGAEGAERVPGEYVSEAYFATLGITPALGRGFSDKAGASAQPEVVVSREFWRHRFGSDPSAIGRSLRIGGLVFTIVGIMPASFRGLTDEAQLWLPPAFAPQLSYPDYLTTPQNFISVVGRIAPDVTVDAANAEVASFARQLQQAVPNGIREDGVAGGSAIPLDRARIDVSTQRALLLLLAAVMVLYLIAAANSTSLFLERAITERRAAAIRASLGASPRQLFVHYFERWGGTALVGGAIGVGLALLAGRHLIAPTDIWRERRITAGVAPFADPQFGARVLLFGLVLAIVTALLVAWGPAIAVSRGDLLQRIRSGSGGSAPGSGTLRRPTTRGLLVAGEVALAVILVVAAGLLLDSYRRMRATDFGVDPDQVVSFMVMPPLVRYPDSTGPRFVASMLDGIASVPGVVSATVDGGVPANGSARGQLHIVGREEPSADQLPVVTRHYVSPDHFRTLGISLVTGRGFTARDRVGSPAVAVISRSAANRFWPGQDPIGQRIWFGPGSGFESADSSAEVVGVVADVIDQPLRREPNLDAVYTPYLQYTPAWRYVFVRANGDPLAIMPEVRGIIRRLEPDAIVSEVNTLPAMIAGSWGRNRFDAMLFGGFGLMGLLLAAGGIFALVLHGVTQRTREMGIRMALGSSPVGIMRLIMLDGMRFPVAGLVTGIGGSLLLTRLLQSSLYGVRPTEPRIFGVTVLLLLAITALACLLPARRAAQVDPLVAMRVE